MLAAMEHLLPPDDGLFRMPSALGSDPSCFHSTTSTTAGDPQMPVTTDLDVDDRETCALPRDDVRVESLTEAAPWGLVLNTILYMASPMSMPATFAQAGWTWGSIYLVYSSIITYHTGLLLGDICQRMPHLGSFPSIAAHCGGKAVMWAVITMQFLTFWIDSSAQMLYCAQYLGQLLPSWHLCQSDWLLVVAAATLPLMQIPTFQESRWFALPTFGVLVLILAVFFYEAILVAPWQCAGEQLTQRPSYPQPPPQKILLSGSTFAYAFGGHGMFPEEIRELRDKTQWNRVVMPWTYAIIVPMYMSTSVLGFYVWGGGQSGANANINVNFPPNTANTVSIVVQFLLTYYLIFFTSLCLALNLEIALGIDPRLYCAPKEPLERAYTDGSTISTHQPRWMKPACSCCNRVPPVVARGVLRSLLLASQLGLCQMLLGGEADTLLSLQSLSGAIGMVAFTYCLPFFFHWKLFPAEVGKVRAVWYGVNGAIGIGIMATGVYVAMFDLVDSSFTIGGAVCDIVNDDGDYFRGCPRYVNGSAR